MSEKHLNEVVDEIKYLIDQGKANDALPLTHLLLSHYPRYIQGYQLLAEIALEEGYIADAIEVLQRILSADPESFVAHAGLAVAFKNQEQAEDALWHIQRAFEMEPRLREVREEVRQISQLHTGHRPGRLRLNGAALSRMYMREGTYEQAVKQLKSELDSQQNRVDLQVALAEAEWFAQRHEDAVRTSRQALQELPLSLKINLILGQFYAQRKDLGQAERFLHVVQQLDPANELSAAWFGKAGYLQARDVIIPLNDDASQNGNKVKMPRWLSNLSLFAAHDSEAQQESPAVTSIDDFEDNFDLESGFVDANPIDEADASPVISIDSDFDFSAEPTAEKARTLEPEPASDWADEIGADRELIEPHFIEEPLEPPSSALQPSPSVGEALTPAVSSKPEWREALRTESWDALNQRPTLETSSTEADIASPADWLARLRAETEAALVEQQAQTPIHVVEEDSRDDFSRSASPETTEVVTTSQKEYLQEQPAQSIPEWQSALALATHAALAAYQSEAEAELAQPDVESAPEPTFEPFVDAPAKMDWRHGLIAATHAALADADAHHQAAQSEEETAVDSVGTLDWRQQLTSATHAALADADAHHQGAQSEEETAADSVGMLDWRQQVTSATHAALAEHEALPGADVVASALSSEETTPAALDESAHPAWKDALKVETEAHLASWTAPSALEEAQIEVETAVDQVAPALTSPSYSDEPVGWLQPLQQTEELTPRPKAKARRRLGKRWIEGLRFETEVWLTTMRRVQRESEQTGPLTDQSSAPIVAEEELAISRPPLGMTPEPSEVAQQARVPLAQDTTVEAAPPELTTLPSQIEPEEAVRPWVTSLRLQTEEELAAEPTWVAQLDQASQAELAALSTPPTWVAALRAETDTHLADVAQKADLVSQVSDVAEESSSLVANVAQETPPDADIDAQSKIWHGSNDFSRSELPKTTEVVTTSVTEEVSSPVVETPPDADIEAQSKIWHGSNDFSRSELPKTTEVVTTSITEETSSLVAVGEETAQVSQTSDVTDEISSLVADVASETGHLSPSYTNGTATSHPVLRDKWQVARQAWQVGKQQDAYAIYESFFSESDEYDAQLDEALSEWTRIDDAPFLAFQLLGDVYRRMRRMQDAVKQYREAIKRI